MHATDLSRGHLPEGTGYAFLSEALKAHGKLPTRQLILEGIINPETQQAFKSGIAAQDTLIGKCATKALMSLGITPTAYRYEILRDSLNIVIDTTR